jgi:apolipoprotein N-acyltransferase
LNIHTNPVGTWGATGFTQYGNLPLMQLASVTGMIGITFLMGWFASTANWAWENQSRGGQVIRGLVAFGAVLAVVLVFGFVRLNLSPISETDETVRVAGITAISGLDYDSDEKFLSAMESIRDAYFSETEREAQAGARVIVWPELSGRGPASDEAALIARAQEVARQNEIYLFLPLGTFYPPETGQLLENELLVIDPAGSIVIDHIKFGGQIFEGAYRVQGDGKLQTVTTPFGVLSGAICYDLDYPAVIQQSGRNNTGLMLVPSSDWFEIDPVHSHMAVFRAIENGMSLVRQTHTGLSIAVDPYGRVLAQTDFFGATDRTMVAQVPVRDVTTIYSLFGRWFEWACLVGFLLVVAWALIALRPAKSTE